MPTDPTGPAPAVSAEGRRPWRIGQHYGIHVYEGDRPVATFHRPEDAAKAVEAVNAAQRGRTTEGGDDEPRI